MASGTRIPIGRSLAAATVGAIILLAAGCTGAPAGSVPPGDLAPAFGQPQYDSDAAAFQAMLTAAKTDNRDEVHHILGPDWKDLTSGDQVEDTNAFQHFAERAAEKNRLEQVNDHLSIIHIGNDDWPFPIPIARLDNGKWYFDTREGKTEILARRVGENELRAIDTCKKLVQAQQDYHAKDHTGNGVPQYAQRIISSPGKMDGLYWKVQPGAEPSPLQHLFEAAKAEGYNQTQGQPREPFHGYLYHILKQQGPAAPGGKADYLANGNLTRGFAIVAFPAEYEASGVMTFIVNQDGTIYQKDLGKNTTEIARSMKAYNPDPTWTQVKD